MGQRGWRARCAQHGRRADASVDGAGMRVPARSRASVCVCVSVWMCVCVGMCV